MNDPARKLILHSRTQMLPQIGQIGPSIPLFADISRHSPNTFPLQFGGLYLSPDRKRWRRERNPIAVKSDETDQVRIDPVLDRGDFHMVHELVTHNIIAAGVREERRERFGALFNRG